MPKALSDIPHGLRGVYRRFQHWRNKHPQARLPIPKRLWFAAGEAARENGVGRTAQALGLEYGKLKRLAESSAVAAKAAATPPTFVGKQSVWGLRIIAELKLLTLPFFYNPVNSKVARHSKKWQAGQELNSDPLSEVKIYNWCAPS
jgi:hypothetical protein